MELSHCKALSDCNYVIYEVLISSSFLWTLLSVHGLSLLQSTVLHLHGGMERAVQYRALIRAQLGRT